MSFAESQKRIATAEPVSVDRRSPADWAAMALTFCFTVATILCAFYPSFSRQSWIPFAEDDFFYYLKVAQNFAHGHGSTFNGIVATNGYHPLWFMVLAVLSFFSTSGTAIKVFLSIAFAASTLATYFLCRALMYRAGLKHYGTEGLLANALACYCAIYSMHLYLSSMEVTLTIPLILSLACFLQRGDLWDGGFARFVSLGLLVSAVVLSRLDTSILMAMLFVGVLVHPGLRKRIVGVQAAGLIAGIVPLLLYFASNQVFFRTWLPVSGMAKQLKTGHHPSSAAWHSLFSKPPLQLLNVAVVALAILLLPVIFRRLTTMQQVLFSSLLLFPFLYISILSCVSDWKLWDWYFYAFRPAVCVALILFVIWRPTAQLLRNAYVTGLIALFMFAYVAKMRRTSAGGDTMYQSAIFVQGFSATHPGVYAMGDRAGMVGYLLPDPLVQTEGLVMDRDFLDVVKQRTPLRDALKKYGVRYYISVATKPYAGCYLASEPYEAGPASPHMVAEFCEPPVAEFTDTDGLKTLIYQMK
jgi:hypothetical protein